MFAIKYFLKKKKLKKCSQLIEECFESLKYQILNLNSLLEFKDHKIYSMIQNKTQFLVKLYAIELSKHQIENPSSSSSTRLQFKYNEVLNKIPNSNDLATITNFVSTLFEPLFENISSVSNFANQEDPSNKSTDKNNDSDDHSSPIKFPSQNFSFRESDQCIKVKFDEQYRL